MCETWDTDRDNSQIQFLLGHVMEWFYGGLAGIRPDPEAPGFGHIVICPNVVGDLTGVKASYDPVRGKIVSEWKRDGRHLALHVVIPPNAKATVSVPTGRPDSGTEGGRPTAELASVEFVRMTGPFAVYEVGSGDSTFGALLP